METERKEMGEHLDKKELNIYQAISMHRPYLDPNSNRLYNFEKFYST